MNKEKLIQMLEYELVQADGAKSDEAFHKHIYAIHALTGLYSEQAVPQHDTVSSPQGSASASSKMAVAQVSDEEIRRMGGQVASSSRSQTTSDARMVTDDEIGNGASIFDF
ncbi:DUF5327 family protein [Staphylococcus lutrae]|uniref:YwdI family protein n=1 Tax=Staphylococcus lutrae TaxID=155085 RepID=A0AAC9RTY5_9STAP|nr:DUF5327 family protein [Staphylococcus lutrae]ARJ51129.1 hypothetical protein B5P37_07340 [Staphylococcus lutrae]PNZ34812.1 hypothetical protein CD134_09955 [Staphylococcus lutrae]